MRKGRLGLRLAGMLVMAAACWAQEAPAPRVVELAAADGVKLKATYFAAAKPGPGVLLLHQCNQQRKKWDELAGRLAAAGIHVLTLDYRGYGESGGTPYQQLVGTPMFAQIMAYKWPTDIDLAYDYLLAQPGVKGGIVGASGASCGVNNAIQLARRHPEVKSLVLLSGGTDRDGRTFLRKSEKLPELFAAASDDDGAAELMQLLYDLSPNPGSRYVHYQMGGHGVDMFPVHKELPGMIVDWYVQTLVTTPGSAPAGKANEAGKRSAEMLELIDSPSGAEKAAAMLAEARKKDPHAKLFSEFLVNMLGYEHLQAGDNKGAIEILQLNVAAYPNSPNVYDSLSDAYLADGQKELARENAKKALELLPSDTVDDAERKKGIQGNAEMKLKQLSEKP